MDSINQKENKTLRKVILMTEIAFLVLSLQLESMKRANVDIFSFYCQDENYYYGEMYLPSRDEVTKVILDKGLSQTEIKVPEC